MGSEFKRVSVITQGLEDLGPYKNLHVDVYSSFIHNCPNMEATKMSFSRQMDEHTWVRPDSGVLFGAKQQEHKRKPMDSWGGMRRRQRLFLSERSQSENASNDSCVLPAM